MISNCKGAQVHDAPQPEGRRCVGRKQRCVLSEDHLGGTDDAILTFAGIVWKEQSGICGNQIALHTKKNPKKTTLWLDLCLHTSIIHTYWYEQISPEYKSHKPLGLRRDNHREATKVRALHQWLRINQETNVISIISIRIPNLFPRNIGVICAVVPPPPPQSCPPAWAQPARGPSSSASSRPPPGCCVQTLLLAPGTGIHSAWCEPAKHQEHAGFTSPFLKGGGKKPKQ